MSAVSVLLFTAATAVGLLGERGVMSGGVAARGAGGGGVGVGRGAGAPISAGRASGASIGSTMGSSGRVSIPTAGARIDAPSSVSHIQVPAPAPRMTSPGRLGNEQGSLIHVGPRPGLSDDPAPRGSIGRVPMDDSPGFHRNQGLSELTPRDRPTNRETSDPPNRPLESGRTGRLGHEGSNGKSNDILGSSHNPFMVPRDRGVDRDFDDHASRGRLGSINDERLNRSLVVADTLPPSTRGVSFHGNGSWSFHTNCNCWNSWNNGSCWHHSHCFHDSWWCCGVGWGWSWGFFFCNDWWNPWCWYYWPSHGYPVYLYYPYPYTTYSYVDTSYVNEKRDYPALPTETYVDPNANQTSLIEQGKTLFEKGDYLSAAEIFRQAILKDLNNPIAKFGYAHALFAIGNYPFAALAIRMGMKVLPDWPILGGDLRDLYGKPEDFTNQMKALEQYLAQRPDDPGALLVSGYVNYFTGDLDHAESSFEHLLELDSNDPVAQKFVDSLAAVRSGQAALPGSHKLQPAKPAQPGPVGPVQPQPQAPAKDSKDSGKPEDH